MFPVLKHLSAVLKCSSLLQHAFIPLGKSVHLLHNKCICLLFKSWFRKPSMKNRNSEKMLYKTSSQLRIDLHVKKGQKQGRDERMQEHYLTSVAYFCKCQVVFVFFHFSLVCVLISGPSLTEMKFTENSFPNSKHFFWKLSTTNFSHRYQTTLGIKVYWSFQALL